MGGFELVEELPLAVLERFHEVAGTPGKVVSD
jgi:hypothetical protein